MTKTAAEIERDVEALKQKMTPSNLFDEAARYSGDAGKHMATKIVEQARANPLPLALIGLGIGWLVVSNRQDRTQTVYVGETRTFSSDGEIAGDAYGYDSAYADGETSGGRIAGLKQKAQGVGQKASDALSSVRGKLSGGASHAGQSGRSAVQNLNQKASSVAGAVSQKASEARYRAQQTYTDTLESEPLIIAGLGVLVGAAIGAALPSTPAEDRLLGEHRDKLVGKGKDLAQTGLQQAGSAAQAAYGTVKTELQQPGDLNTKLENAARSGVQAAQGEFQQSSLQ
jgi:hypothetical protein